MGAQQLLGMVGSDEMRSAVRTPIQIFEGVKGGCEGGVKAKHPDERQGAGVPECQGTRCWGDSCNCGYTAVSRPHS